MRREFEDLVRRYGWGIGDENEVRTEGRTRGHYAQEYERVIEELMVERTKREELEQRLHNQINPQREAYNNDDLEDDGLNYPL